MKAIYFLDSVNVGGTEVLALDVCRNASAAGIDLTFVTTRGGEMEPEFRESGVEFIRLSRKGPLDISLVKQLRRIIREREIKIIHTHQAVEAMHAHLASRGTGAKVVLTHHGFVPDAKNRLALKFLMTRVAKNLFVSRGLREWYRTDARLDADARSTVLYNGIDPKRLAYAGPPIRESLGFPNDAILFGMIANFYSAPRKDQKTLVEAFVRVAPLAPTAHLALIGSIEDGAETKFAECVQLAKESGLEGRIHFLGRRNDIPAILDVLDVFVLSSLHEGLGIAAVEAMMTRTPCILSDIAPLREVAGDGLAAELFSVGDPIGLAEKMLMLAEDAAARSDLAERGFRYAMENFGIETHLKNLSTIYAEVSGK